MLLSGWFEAHLGLFQVCLGLIEGWFRSGFEFIYCSYRSFVGWDRMEIYLGLICHTFMLFLEFVSDTHLSLFCVC